MGPMRARRREDWNSIKALRDRGLGDEVGTGDLGHGEPADEAKGQGHPRRRGQDRVAGDEDQAKAVVIDLLPRLGLDRLPVVDRGRQLAPDLGVLGRQGALAAEGVDRLTFAHRREPSPRVARRPVAWPLAERISRRVLSRSSARVMSPVKAVNTATTRGNSSR